MPLLRRIDVIVVLCAPLLWLAIAGSAGGDFLWLWLFAVGSACGTHLMFWRLHRDQNEHIPCCGTNLPSARVVHSDAR